jgi:hypothetical protein
MPNKKKIGKKSKLKRKMKGGWRGDPNDMPEDYPEPTPAQVNRAMAIQNRMEKRAAIEKASVKPSAPPLEKVPMAKPGIPVAKATPIAKSKQGGSSYQKYSDSAYIAVITAIGLMGILWFMISRSMIKHKYSEVLSYSLLATGVFLSLFLIIFKGVRQVKPSNSIIGAIKNMLFVAKYLAIRSVPGLLILLQLAVLCYIMYNHADYIFSSENIPTMFNVFNAITIVMILGQCWVWKDKVKEIMSNVVGPKNPMIVPGFILAAILSGISISQLYIILEYLKTDC